MLQYKNLHCLHYANEESSIFHRLQLNEGEVLPYINQKAGILLYVAEGLLEVEEGDSSRHIPQGNIIFLSQNEPFRGHATASAVMLTCNLPFHVKLCHIYDLQDLRREMADKQPELHHPRKTQLSAYPPIKRVFSSVLDALDEELYCIHYQELKRQELLLLLRLYHKAEELHGLFAAILHQNNAFKQFVFENYRHVNDVNEFASQANMSLRNFQRRFKAEFSCSAREWLIARRAESVRQELRATNKDLMTIATEYGFSSMSYFTSFCKNYFGMTPSEIRGTKAVKAGRILQATGHL